MMLVVGGKERTEDEFRALLEASGWRLNRNHSHRLGAVDHRRFARLRVQVGGRNKVVSLGVEAPAGLDPISWTRSERWIRCPEWQQPHVGGHAGNSVTSSGLGRSGWCWKRGRRSAPSPAELDLTESALRQWVERARADRSGGRTGLTTAEREELARLRKENRILAEERDILKKATAFFAKQSR